MATTTGTTRATTTGSGWCAAESEAAGIFTLRDLWQAYEACRRRKRGNRDAQRYDQQLLDRLHGHHAHAWRLFQRVFERHPWVRTLFTLHDGLSLRRRWLPPAVSGLRGQWRWFAEQWPDAVVLLQTGHRFEVYDRQAQALARWLNAPLDLVPRCPFSTTLSWPLKALRGLRCDLRRAGVAHLFVAEEGHLPGGLKRRVLRLAWWPHRSRLPLWAEPRGVQA